MSLAATFGLVGYFIFRLVQIYEYNPPEHEYSRIEITYSEEEMINQGVTLGRFNNSMNFAFGLTSLGENFDILANPYVEFLGLELFRNHDKRYTSI